MEELKRDRVARILKQRIGRGTVKNGSWLSVAGVAREFGVSRSTAKNADNPASGGLSKKVARVSGS